MHLLAQGSFSLQDPEEPRVADRIALHMLHQGLI
jgi:hypothetical protein